MRQLPPRGPTAVWVLGAAMVASAMVAFAAPTPAAPAGPALASATPAQAEALAPVPTSGSMVAGTGYAAVATLDLADGALHAGNFVPGNGLEPYTDLYDPTLQEVFVANLASGSISVVSTVSDRLVATFPTLGDGALFLALDNLTGELFVPSYSSHVVEVYDASTGARVAQVGLGGNTPYGIVYDPATQLVYVADTPCFASCVGELVAINPRTDEVARSVTVGEQPYGVTYDPATDQLFVVNAFGGTVSVVNAASLTVAATLTVGSIPVCAVYDPNVGDVYVANEESNNVTVLSAAHDTVVANVSVGDSPGGITADPLTGVIYVSNYDDANVSVVDDATNTVTGTVAVGEYPWGGALDPANGVIYLTITGDDAVDLVSGLVTIGAITLGDGPSSAVFDTGTDQLFVDGTGNVTVVSAATNRVVASVPMPGYPQGMAYDPTLDEVFVACPYAGIVAVISDVNDTVVANLSVPGNPYGVAFDPGVNALYVTNEGSPNVTAISLATDAETPIGVDELTGPIAYAAGYDELFVANAFNSTNVTILNDLSNTDVGILTLPDTGPVRGLVVDPQDEELVVLAGPVTSGVCPLIAETSSGCQGELYAVNLPALSFRWSEEIPGDDLQSASDTLAVGPGGTQIWSTGAGGGALAVLDASTGAPVARSVAVGELPEGVTVDPSTGVGFVANYASGTVTIVAEASAVSFRETGLPRASSWSVAIGSWGITASGNVTKTSTSIGLELPNGTTPIVVRAPSGYAVARIVGPNGPTPSSITVSGASKFQLHFRPIVRLSFHEAGLVSGTSWTVVLVSGYRTGGAAGETNSSTGSWVNFTIVGGPWKFTIAPVPTGYRAVPGHGSVSLGKHGAVRTIHFRVSEAHSPLPPSAAPPSMRRRPGARPL